MKHTTSVHNEDGRHYATCACGYRSANGHTEQFARTSAFVHRTSAALATAPIELPCRRCKAAPFAGCVSRLMPNTPSTTNLHAERIHDAAQATFDAQRVAASADVRTADTVTVTIPRRAALAVGHTIRALAQTAALPPGVDAEMFAAVGNALVRATEPTQKQEG